MSDADEVVLIEHSKLIDGFEELTEHRRYLPLKTYCSICDSPFTVSPKTQKYMLEVKAIPVKMLRRGAVFCVDCRRRRSRINWLRSGEQWRSEPDGEEELKRLLAEEQNLKSSSQSLYEHAAWPYESRVAGIIRWVLGKLLGPIG